MVHGVKIVVATVVAVVAVVVAVGVVALWQKQTKCIYAI